MQYVIVKSVTAESLAKIVNSRIEAGWTPLGGVSVQFDPLTRITELFQAMIMEAKNA